MCRKRGRLVRSYAAHATGRACKALRGGAWAGAVGSYAVPQSGSGFAEVDGQGKMDRGRLCNEGTIPFRGKEDVGRVPLRADFRLAARGCSAEAVFNKEASLAPLGQSGFMVFSQEPSEPKSKKSL